MRTYRVFVGNIHARRLFYLPVWSRKWWSGVRRELRWYMRLEKEPGKSSAITRWRISSWC
jgi:Ni/Fe-hydrogenase 1 B-type cytochrome subunit